METTSAELAQIARKRGWGLALILVGWLHLACFLTCYYLEFALKYHEPATYASIWIGEVLGMLLIYRTICSVSPADPVPTPLELVIRRIWIAYFVLAFNLASLNTLRGHVVFELFPAIATLASFAFIMMTLLVSPRFFLAVLTMFFSGLLMAAFFEHAFLIFATAWWLVLNAIGYSLS